MCLDGGDLIECAICATLCYCCFKALEGNSSSNNRNRNEPQTVIVQHQPYPSGYPQYGTGAQPYYPGPQGQQPGGYNPYPPQPGPGYYPPGNTGQAYPYPPTHNPNAPPYAPASAPPPYDHSRY